MPKITFNDVPPEDSYGQIDEGYGGLTWGNVGALDVSVYPGSGYDNVNRGTGDDVAYTYGKGGSLIRSTRGDFDLDSGWFAAAWLTGLKVIVKAYNDNIQVARLVFVLDQDAKRITFDNSFDDVDQLYIIKRGGVDENLDDEGTGRQVAIDNLLIGFESDTDLHFSENMEGDIPNNLMCTISYPDLYF